MIHDFASSVIINFEYKFKSEGPNLISGALQLSKSFGMCLLHIPIFFGLPCPLG